MDQFTAQMIKLELTKEEVKVIKDALWYFVEYYPNGIRYKNGVNPDGLDTLNPTPPPAQEIKCANQYHIDWEVAERMLTVLRKS